eukprot:scpid10050/ scgid4048/ von Willebrand factor A domain-containing protein 3A
MAAKYSRKWTDVAIDGNARPPSAMTVTSIQQHHELQQIVCDPPILTDGMTSKEWLAVHGPEAVGLQRSKVLEACGPRRPPFATSSDYSNILAWDESHSTNVCGETRAQPVAVSIDPIEAQRVEAKLLRNIRAMQERLQWLKVGSRKTFGYLPGNRVAILIDCSSVVSRTCDEDLYRAMLKSLVQDQLRHKETVLPVMCADDASLLWSQPHHLDDSRFSPYLCRALSLLSWMASFAFAGSCNLMDGLRKVALHAGDLDCVTVVLASQACQRSSLLVDFARQLVVGRSLKLHLVSINCDDSTKACLHEIASRTESVFHFYEASADAGEEVFSQDIMDMQKELECQYNTVHHLRQLMSGRVDLGVAEQLHKIKSFSEWPKDETTLEIASSGPRKQHMYVERPYLSSMDWLVDNSLKSQNLSIYQFLAPNSIPSRSQFVGVLQKDVAAQVFVDRMTQFTWFDDTIRHVHVDAAELYEYQHKLDDMMDLYRKRISWLKSDTRRIFGTITSKNVVLLVDTSTATASCQTQLQEHLCQFLGEQIAFCETFNLVHFNSSEVALFKPKPVTTSSENLSEALRWLLSWQCAGSCDLMSGLKCVLEGDGLVQVDLHPYDSIRVVVTGCPVQNEKLLLAYLSQRLLLDPVTIDTVLYTCGTEDGNVLEQNSMTGTGHYLSTKQLHGYVQRLAHQFDGVFHWYDHQGSVDSDDIRVIEEEVEKAKEFSRKAGLLGEHMRQNAERYREEALDKRPAVSAPPQPPPATRIVVGPPRETVASSARKDISAQKIAAETKKAVTRKKGKGKRPSTAPSRKPPALALSHDSFLLDDGKSGVAIRTASPSVHRSGSRIASSTSSAGSVKRKKSSGIGDCITTQKWLKKNSLEALDLDLHRLVKEFDFGNQHANDSVLSKPFIRNKFCALYPHVTIGNSLYHLRYTEQELQDYINALNIALHAYIDRLVHLLSGSRRVFGQVLESKCCIMLDVSGSMSGRMHELQAVLYQFVDDQMEGSKKRCCLLAFNSETACWNPDLQEITVENKHEVRAWIRQLQSCGSTDMMSALQCLGQVQDIQAVYVLTDGLPDQSVEAVLERVKNIHEVRRVPFHSVSFLSAPRPVDSFLKKMSSSTGGHHHKCVTEACADAVIMQLCALQHNQPLPSLCAADTEPDSSQNQATDDSAGNALPPVAEQAVGGLVEKLSLAASGPKPSRSGIVQGSRRAWLGSMQREGSHQEHVGRITCKLLRLMLKELHGDQLRPLCTELLTANKNHNMAYKYRDLLRIKAV